MNFSYNKLVIIFLVVSLVLISYAIWKSVRVDNKQANPDVPTNCTGTDCKVECGVTSPLTIKECQNTEDGKKICSNCKCDASGRLSGCMECKESDPSNPSLTYSIRDISKDQCTDPFQWDDDARICSLKKGFFCLPHNINPIDCNPYTGRQLLTFDTTNNVYEWTCVCKNNNKFSGSICNQINVCGMEGSIQNPDNSNTGRGLVNIKNSDDYWNYKKSKWDPLAMDSDGNYINSACSCLSNEFADNKNLLCLPNDCYPGSNDPDDPKICDCKCQGCAGLVDCNMISTSFDPQFGTYYNGVCKRPSCIPDPCGGPKGEYGYYDFVKDKDGNVISGTCVCNEKDGYYLVPDPSSYTGFKCSKLCQNNGPCGNRGKCVVNKLDKSFTNFTIVCKDQDENGQCAGSGLFFIKYNTNSTTYYLNYNKNNKSLTLDCSQKEDSYFSFKLRSCDSRYNDGVCVYKVSDKIKNGLISGSYYYMMIGDQYLIFYDNLTFDLVNEDSNLKEKSLFLFASSVGNKRPLPVINGTIFFDSIQRYLSLTSQTPPSIIYDLSSKTQEICDPCYGDNGWRQDINDTNQSCQESCQTSGYTYDFPWVPDEHPFGSKDPPPGFDEDSFKICCYGGTYTNDYNVNCNPKNQTCIYFKRKKLKCAQQQSTPPPSSTPIPSSYC